MPRTISREDRSDKRETWRAKRDVPTKIVRFTRGSDNVFADLALEAPEEELAKAKLVVVIKERIGELRLNQQAVATRLGITQPKVSKILRGNTTGVSTDWLITTLRKLGNDVEICIIPVKQQTGHLYVSLDTRRAASP